MCQEISPILAPIALPHISAAGTMGHMKPNHALSEEACRKLNSLIGQGRVHSQSSLSRLTGIQQSAISDFILGKRGVFADDLAAIAKALGVTVDWLLDDAQKERPAPELSEAERWLIKSLRRLGVEPDQVVELVARRPATDPPKASQANRVDPPASKRRKA